MVVKSELFMHSSHRPLCSARAWFTAASLAHTHTCMHAWTHAKSHTCPERRAPWRKMPRQKLFTSESDGKYDSCRICVPLTFAIQVYFDMLIMPSSSCRLQSTTNFSSFNIARNFIIIDNYI